MVFKDCTVWWEWKSIIFITCDDDDKAIDTKLKTRCPMLFSYVVYSLLTNNYKGNSIRSVNQSTYDLASL